LLIVGVVAPLASCGILGGDDRKNAAVAFIDALVAGDIPAAAAATDDPPAAREVLVSRTALEPVGFRADRIEVVDQPGGPEVRFQLDWDFGHGRRWTYQSSAGLRQTSDGWILRWAPSVLHPKLEPGQALRLDTLTGSSPPVLDRGETELLSEQPVVSVLLDPAAADPAPVAARLATALQRFEPTLTQQSILDGAAKASRAPYTVIVLRRPDYQQVQSTLEGLPGVEVVGATRLLTPDRKLSSPVLDELRSSLQKQLATDAGWRIGAIDKAGELAQSLHEVAPQTTPALATGLDIVTQRAAQAALAPMDQQAMLVAIQPSSGELLAVAQTPAADRQGAPALTGLYPPGSTFKIVTTAAVLQAGAATPNTVLACPGTENIRGRQIKNDDFALGNVPLHSAFAHSCNTTLARLAVDLPPDALTRAAEQFSLGVDFVMPGATTVTGSVPPAPRSEQRVEWSIGQGEVLASPFGMALLTASVARGGPVTPVLIRNRETTVDRSRLPVNATIAEQVRAMMREIVTDGTARALAGLPGVAGKTGTAQYGDGIRSHGWFVAIAGDLAVAVLVVDGNTSAPAVQAAKRFLEPLLR
jgi:hypothetical protein